MLRRSVLFSPGDRPELLRKAPGTGADTIVFDLEDAVAPARKDEARDAVRAVLADPEFEPDAEVCVRVNPVEGSGATADEDVEALFDGPGGDDTAGRPDALMLPKCTDGDDVDALDALVPGETPPVLALVESAAGVLHAESVAAADATDALVFGAEDLSADIGATRTDEGTEVLYAREHVVLAAAAVEVDAIDTVYTDFSDSEGLREATEFAIELGYDGKMAIHPSQVSIVNEAFTPDPETVEWAERVLAAKAEADAEDRGVFQVDGEMIDAPLVAQAERVVARATAADEI
ncbi:HpcH/HpaI aldolase/citrate lyase family protein [Haloarchaeobius iranensis]|uniref:Citrate lyase subunit beta / citryl-CoA lyase n=1 Tax=Haloarchaeobius iranensis TaxID=996166 RepID=A0A1G9TQ21_9EURY|nr:CoA ester lyase [Haloarchaeobius iranensis]SDM49638.1 citrate lyase subunit beta / citryl-CoA lyase [Haloarchaeobius iranensis]